MRERLERMLGRQARAAWILTFHAACGRMLRREAERLGYTSSFTIYDQADQVRVVKACLEDLGVDPKRFTPARHPQPDLEREEPADRPGRVHEPRRVVLRQDGRRGLRALPAAAARLERGRLRRHADAHGRGARALPRRARPLAAHLPLHPRRRVPGHEPRAVPAAAAARRRARERVRGRRPGSVGLWLPRRRHQQHPRLRARLPRRALDRARAELPLDELDPRRRQRGDREQPRPEAEAALLGARRGRAGAGRRGRGRAHRGALRRGRDRPSRRRGLVGGRARRLLPDERAEPRARGRARAAADPLPGDRRPALLRARRDQGRDRLPVRARQPLRRGLAAADRKPPSSRDRRHVVAAARHPCRRARGDAVRGDGRPGGGRPRDGGDQGGARVPHADAVAAVVGAGARGRRARRGGARAERHDRGARGGADDRGARPDREPGGARRRRARVPSRAGGADAVGVPAGDLARLRPGRRSPASSRS